MTNNSTSFDMPAEIEDLVANMSSLQRKYCEFRSMGLKQGEAANKAGSEAQGAGANRVGYQYENMPGSKEYIEWLKKERGKVSGLEEAEVVRKLREVYKEAMLTGDLKSANKAIELMGTAIGMWGSGGLRSVGGKVGTAQDSTKAFKEDDEGIETEDRIKKLQDMMVTLNKV